VKISTSKWQNEALKKRKNEKTKMRTSKESNEAIKKQKSQIEYLKVAE
jgi:hypothetical protein